jgi:hypothetical protein
MKQVYSSIDGGETGLIQSLLDAAGIRYEVRNEAVAQTEAPFPPWNMELWVLRDEDYQEARTLIQSKDLQPLG